VRQALVAALLLALPACSMLPAAAPTSTELEDSVQEAGQAYLLVNVDEKVAAILRSYRRPAFASRFKTRGYAPTDILHPGDIIGVSIYEVGGGALFGSPPSGGQQSTSLASGVNTTIPPQAIEADGTIMVPFAGRVRVSGLTPGQVGQRIQKALQGKAIEPQVVVTLVSNTSNTATVGGDVNQPKPVPLTLRGERILDVVAAAGGARYPAYEMYVTLIRHGRIGTVLLQAIVADPRENIRIRPNDQTFLTRYPRTFAVLGATTKVSQYTFDTAKVTLAEAVARAGGPIDAVGNPSGIYLFRFEPVSVAEKILGKRPEVTKSMSKDVGSDFVPILYKVDFRKAGGYFQAQDINIQDKDVVLVTNSESTQIQKLVGNIRGFTGIAYDLKRGVN